MKALLALLLLAVSAAACSQPSPRVAALLDHLQSYAKDYRERLPSLSCDESITSRVVENGKVKKEVRIEAVLREIRDNSEPDSFTDQYEFKLVNGQPPKSHFKVPYFVSGAFSNSMGLVAPRDQDVCFDYQLAEENGGATLRLELAAKPQTSDPACNEILEGYRKSVMVDTATGVIRHITRSMSAAAARSHREVLSASIDYGPVTLGEQTFWLPVRVEAHHWDGHGQMTATYSDFHRYTGELKVLPGQVQAEPTVTQ